MKVRWQCTPCAALAWRGARGMRAASKGPWAGAQLAVPACCPPPCSPLPHPCLTPLLLHACRPLPAGVGGRGRAAAAAAQRHVCQRAAQGQGGHRASRLEAVPGRARLPTSTSHHPAVLAAAPSSPHRPHLITHSHMLWPTPPPRHPTPPPLLCQVLNFSIAYGKTAHGLSKDWKVDLTEAQDTVERWYSDRPEVRGSAGRSPGWAAALRCLAIGRRCPPCAPRLER